MGRRFGGGGFISSPSPATQSALCGSYTALCEEHLRRVLNSYAGYYNEMRTHWSLNKDAPASRPVQQTGNVMRFWAVSITATSESRFLVHTGAFSTPTGA